MSAERLQHLYDKSSIRFSGFSIGKSHWVFRRPMEISLATLLAPRAQIHLQLRAPSCKRSWNRDYRSMSPRFGVVSTVVLHRKPYLGESIGCHTVSMRSVHRRDGRVYNILSHRITQSALHLISTTKWAHRRASSLKISSQTFGKIPAVSYPNGSPLSSSISSPPPQLKKTSLRDSEAIPQDPCPLSHGNCAVAIRPSASNVPPAN